MRKFIAMLALIACTAKPDVIRQVENVYAKHNRQFNYEFKEEELIYIDERTTGIVNGEYILKDTLFIFHKGTDLMRTIPHEIGHDVCLVILGIMEKHKNEIMAEAVAQYIRGNGIETSSVLAYTWWIERQPAYNNAKVMRLETIRSYLIYVIEEREAFLSDLRRVFNSSSKYLLQ